MIRGQRPGGPASSPYGRPGLSQPQRQFNSSGRPVVGGKGVARSPASRYALGGGKGRGAVGLGKGGAKRHRKILRDNVQGITKPDIRRLARRGGVKRISGMIYQETRVVIKQYLERIMRTVVAVTDHSKRKTVTVSDVIFALRREGRPIYGFDPETHDGSKKVKKGNS